MSVRERPSSGVCVVSGMRGPFYSSLRLAPAKINMETSSTAFRRIRTAFPPKCIWTGARAGSADPPLAPLATAFLRVSAWWALMLVRRCQGPVGRFGMSGGHLCLCYIGCDLLWFHLCILHVFILFPTCVPAIKNSPTLVEFVSNNSYHFC